MTLPGGMQLVVVGGGPVGLVAGLLAHEAGLSFQVLEREASPLGHSRAIGIHPPSLDLLGTLDEGEALVADLVRSGVRIRRGHAWGERGRRLGTLDFHSLPGPHDFVLTLAQDRTEAILEAALEARAPGALRRGVEVTGIESETGAPRVTLGWTRTRGGGEHGARGNGNGPPSADVIGPAGTTDAGMVLACDGRRSLVRRELGIGFQATHYPVHYLMGDFPEGAGGPTGRASPSATGDEAAIHLHPDGLVESFPLAGGLRRWVAQVEGEGGDVARLVHTVEERCGVVLDPGACSMFSAFRPERGMATELWRERVVLAGDAAHVVSPIGGQGMNLGWLNAAVAVREIAAVLQGARLSPQGARRYEDGARRRATRAARRAEQNMRLANRGPLHALRAGAVRVALASPVRLLAARRFAMQGL
jgi:2-polyprenyl-6-methoxyphenol hydroxylase-like FAD-dependent oxidoreductase